MTDRAIGDYTVALQLDRRRPLSSTPAANSGARRATGPRRWPISAPRSKLNPDHFVAKANYKSLALELEKLAPKALPKSRVSIAPLPDGPWSERSAPIRHWPISTAKSSDHICGCITRSRTPGEKRKLQREQDEFIARRNAGFGRPGYDLRQEMKKRLQEINGIDGY